MTADDMEVLMPHKPLLRVRSRSHCERLNTILDFTRSLRLRRVLTITRRSLPFPFPELVELQRPLALALLRSAAAELVPASMANVIDSLATARGFRLADLSAHQRCFSVDFPHMFFLFHTLDGDSDCAALLR
ncbi:hypothetical protein CUR178_02912 [Leishmania enriettii]|uniref:Uncharacterized protein n=1 Tax=Leishmania enriettii TaxID=5663 RepID=A0A836GDJ2_LEIEN|nr:hypothetical protein CUR178_02912 [Leishmania enriettii]